MKIKVLGRYGRFAPVGGQTNGYLVQTDDGRNIVLDLGAGSLANLQKYIDINDIHAVIITHLHFDHMSDLGTLNYACGYYGIKNLRVYMPATPCDVAAVMSGGFDTVSITDGMKVVISDNVTAQFCRVTHPVETYSVRFWEKKNGYATLLCYTSDCAKSEDIVKCTKGADIVIGDAAILDGKWSDRAPHLSVRQLAENIPDSSRLYLAHLTYGEEDDALAEAKRYHADSRLVDDFDC